MALRSRERSRTKVFFAFVRPPSSFHDALVFNGPPGFEFTMSRNARCPLPFFPPPTALFFLAPTGHR